MIQPDVRILNFLNAHQIITVCFQDDRFGVHCINCFYHFDEMSMSFVLKSSSGTLHDIMVVIGNITAGTVLPRCLEPDIVQGAQWRGVILDSQSFSAIGQKFCSAYERKYPMSLTVPGYFWLIRLDWIKFTENIPGLGEKLVWCRE